MAKQEKQIHFQVKETLFLRIHRMATKKNLRRSQLLRHLVEKSLDLIEMDETLPWSSFLSDEESPTPNPQGKTYTFRNLEYQRGGVPWLADASER